MGVVSHALAGPLHAKEILFKASYTFMPDVEQISWEKKKRKEEDRHPPDTILR